MPQGKRLTIEFINEIRKVVREENARYKNTSPTRQRWTNHRTPSQPFRFRWAVLTTDLASGSTASAQFLKWDSGTSDFVVDTGNIQTVRPKFAFSNGPVPSGTEITVFKQHGVWWVDDTAWCPEDAP